MLDVITRWTEQLVTSGSKGTGARREMIENWTLPDEVGFINCFAEACVIGKQMHRPEYNWDTPSKYDEMLSRNGEWAKVVDQEKTRSQPSPAYNIKTSNMLKFEVFP